MLPLLRQVVPVRCVTGTLRFKLLSRSPQVIPQGFRQPSLFRSLNTCLPRLREPSAIRNVLPDPDQISPAPSTSTSSPEEATSISEKLPDSDKAPRRLREFDLSDKVFVVTGGAQGLGLVLAEAVVEAGGQVHCLDRRDKPSDEFLHVAERAPNNYGGKLFYNQVDVKDAKMVDDVIADVASQHSRLDGLIAAAGVQLVVPALEYDPEEIRNMMDINYRGVYVSAVSCARQMIKYNCPGSLLLVASMSGMVANKGFTSSVYNSSKAAVVQLARSLAMEWGRVIKVNVDGEERIMPIRVNSLCPGNIMTPMVRKNFEDQPELQEIWERANMMGRISTPEEYRGAALFLLSNQASSFMTGASLIVDGGYTAW